MNPSRRVVHVRLASLPVGVAATGLAMALAGCSATNPATIATPFDPAEGRNAQIGGEPGNGGNDGNYQGNGGIKFRNFLVVSQGGDAPGVVVGAISNDTDRAAQLALTVAAADNSGQPTELGTTTVNVPPGGFVQVGNPLAAGGSATSAGGSAATPSATSSTGPTAVPSGAASGSSAATSASQSAGTSSALGPEPAPGQVLWFQVNRVSQPAGGYLQLVARDSSLGSATLDLPILPPVDEYASLTPTTAAPSAPAAGSPTGSPQPTANPSGAAHQPTPSTSG